jgi:exo-beta-1,3-glucanase (GH17 family)
VDLVIGALLSASTPAISQPAAAAPTTPPGAPTQALCAHNPTTVPALTRLQAAMTHGRFIAYEPTSLQVIYGHSTQADPDSIRADLKVLRPRFDALITYDSVHGAEVIPEIAASLGFRAVIIGVWNPFNAAEVDAALAAARKSPKVVVGLSLGNEMLFFHRHETRDLVSLLDAIHARAPQLPLSTTEQFHMFARPELRPVLERLDFLLANVHPIFQPWFHTATNGDSVRFVLNVVTQLGQEYCGPIVVKETGIPTAPEEKGFSERRQAEFYTELAGRFTDSPERALAYFAAFDAPWRLQDTGPTAAQGPAPEEAHWGLYDERRQPKAVVTSIKPLGY